MPRVGVPPQTDARLPAAIHRTQPWFHGRISREDTQQLIGRQGLVDGYGTPGGSGSLELLGGMWDSRGDMISGVTGPCGSWGGARCRQGWGQICWGGSKGAGDPQRFQGSCSPQEFRNLQLGWGDNRPPGLPEGYRTPGVRGGCTWDPGVTRGGRGGSGASGDPPFLGLTASSWCGRASGTPRASSCPCATCSESNTISSCR